jgi:hypothetical protein
MKPAPFYTVGRAGFPRHLCRSRDQTTRDDSGRIAPGITPIVTLIKRALEIETMGVRPSFSELILKT